MIAPAPGQPTPHGRTVPQRRRLPEETEGDFQQRVLDLCRDLALLAYHPYDSRRSREGFPSLVIVGNRVLFVELKDDSGQLSAEQHIWIDRIRAASGDAAVAIWRPSDWSTVEAMLKEMRR